MNVSVSPNLLWPANHKMVAVQPIIQVSDNLDPHPVGSWFPSLRMSQIYGPGAQGIVNSLDAKLEAAQRAQARGQNLVAVNKLNAFIQEVGAQTDKHITSEAAAILIRAAQYVITNLTR